nr:ABC transporter ATP-binding protein [Paenibacillus bovis]
MNVIECSNLVKRYGSKNVLNNMSFTIQENKITGLIGRNGVGKTTLLKIIAGFIHQTSGELKVFGKSPFNNLFVSANSIFIDDQMTLPPALNLGQILEEAARFYENFDLELALRLLDYFAIDAYQYHNNLSKGMTSTFNMIFGLSAHCALTIFDEPTTGMDAAVRKDFYRALLKDYIAYPRTIIISSHHLEEIEDLLEDVMLVKDGDIHLHMPISELKEWAIGVQGKKSVVANLTNEKDIIYQKEVGVDQVYAVMKNDFEEMEIEQARQKGLKFSPISCNDICVYLTNRGKGGIDDVFSRSEHN